MILVSFPGISSETINFLTLIIELLTLLAVLLGLIAIYQNKKQRYFTTVRTCMEDYRKIIRKQQNPALNKNEEFICLLDHLGLISEEIYYIKNRYLPENIALDWIDNMLSFVPLIKNNILLNYNLIVENNHGPAYHEKKFRACDWYDGKILEFPKIVKIFLNDHDLNSDKIELKSLAEDKNDFVRKALVKEIYKKITARSFWFWKKSCLRDKQL